MNEPSDVVTSTFTEPESAGFDCEAMSCVVFIFAESAAAASLSAVDEAPQAAMAIIRAMNGISFLSIWGIFSIVRVSHKPEACVPAGIAFLLYYCCGEEAFVDAAEVVVLGHEARSLFFVVLAVDAEDKVGEVAVLAVAVDGGCHELAHGLGKFHGVDGVEISCRRCKELSYKVDARHVFDEPFELVETIFYVILYYLMFILKYHNINE